MKRMLYLAIFAWCVWSGDATAQKTKDQEYRHVIVTLTSGESGRICEKGLACRGLHFQKEQLLLQNDSDAGRQRSDEIHRR